MARAALKLALAAVVAAAALSPATAQTVYPDAGTPDPAFAPYGQEAYRALMEVCLPAALNRTPLSAAPEVKPVEQPPQWVLETARASLRGGEIRYALRPLPGAAQIWFAHLPAGRLCQVQVVDAPTRGRILTSLDAALRDHGFDVSFRRDGLEQSHRAYRSRRGAVPGYALLDVAEFVYGAGPERHLRLRATLKSFDH